MFDIIVADPPWRYDFSSTRSRRIENQYPTMGLKDICALDVPSICNSNAVLYLWSTAPKLAEALTVMKSWEFQYKTNAVWVKSRLGMGYWFRNQHELVLVGTRGKFSPPAPSLRQPSILEGEHTEHSKKPPSVHEMIEWCFKERFELRKLEMFARTQRKGWDVFSNELEGSITIPTRKVL
jgi:N6-adenosine-specific RNA methylase IME4